MSTTGSPSSTTATQQLDVPRSMPIACDMDGPSRTGRTILPEQGGRVAGRSGGQKRLELGVMRDSIAVGAAREELVADLLRRKAGADDERRQAVPLRELG